MDWNVFQGIEVVHCVRVLDLEPAAVDVEQYLATVTFDGKAFAAVAELVR